MDQLRKLTPGFLYCFGLALIASGLGYVFPIIGGPVFGIVLGILVNHLVGKPEIAMKGILFTSKKILQWAIVFIGCGLSLTQVWKAGIDSFGVMIGSLAAAFIAAFLFGKLLKIPGKMTTLIGAGTGICGGSAIAAVSPIIEAEERDIAYSISTIFLFNVIAVLTFPVMGHMMGLSDRAFGVWSGTAINDTSSVVAAGYAYSNAAGAYATIVKLTRTTMIIPMTIILAIIMGMKKKRQAQTDQTVTYRFTKIFPWFIVWFLVASLANTLGIFNTGQVDVLEAIGKFMIVMALCAIGLNSDFKRMMKTGVKPLILGLIVWFVVAASSILLQSI